MRWTHHFIGTVVLVGLTACATVKGPEATRSEATGLPETLWDFKPEGAGWTAAALDALDGHGAPLVAMTPSDVAVYCPAYAEASRADRKAFWVGFLSALAKHESTWRADVTSPNGRWHGLLQISPATAEGYGCQATSAAALRRGEANLSCAIRIMATTVTRDGVISAGGRGVAADWGPFARPEKRTDISSWTSAQSYCAPS